MRLSEMNRKHSLPVLRSAWARRCRRIIGRQRRWTYTYAENPMMPKVMPMRSFLASHGCGVVLLYRFSRAASLASWITPQHVSSRCFLNIVAEGGWAAIWGGKWGLSKGHNGKKKEKLCCYNLLLIIMQAIMNSGTGAVHVISDATNQNSAKSSSSCASVVQSSHSWLFTINLTMK